MAQPFRFIHCGDLHLGAPFTAIPSLGKYCDEFILKSTYKAFTTIVDTALEEKVDLFLISGDIYNESDHNLEAQVRFVRELERLTNANIKVFIVHGNHDPVNSWIAKINMPKGVHVFSSKEATRIPVILRGKEVCSIYGMSHDKKDIREDLVKNFTTNANDIYSIGLLHASVGAQEGHASYAPTTLEKLLDVGMDYWALGHIHKREVLHEDPFIVYSGNIQGLKSNETGPKGCYLIDVSITGKTTLKFIDASPINFMQTTIDITDLKTINDIQEMIRHKKELAHRKYKKPILLQITLTGYSDLATACHDEETRNLWLIEAQREEKGKYNFTMPFRIIDETNYAIDLKARRALPDVLGDYLAAYDEIDDLNESQKISALRNILVERSEYKRFNGFEDIFTDELLKTAFKRAEIEGAMQIVGEENED